MAISGQATIGRPANLCVPAQFGEHREAVELGHLQIEQQQVRLVG